MKLTGKKAAVLVDQAYQELEVWYPYYRLKEEGCTTHLVAIERGKTYPSKIGYPALSELAVGEINASDYDCVIIPGGYAPDHLRRHEVINKFVEEAMKLNKVVSAICHGGWLLCSAGSVLRGRTVTSFFAIKADMVNAGAEWVDAEVVRNRNLITSRKPDDLPAFMRETIQALSEI